MNRKLKQILFLLVLVLSVGIPFRWSRPLPVFAAVGRCDTVQFFLAGDSNHVPVTPQVGKTYGVIAVNPFYDQNGWPGIIDNNGGRTGRFSYFHDAADMGFNENPLQPNGATYHPPGGGAPGRWISNGTFTVAEKEGETFRIFFKAKLGNGDEQDICEVRQSVEENPDGIPDGQGGCCKFDDDCFNQFGAGSECKGRSGACKTGGLCVGGNQPIDHGGQCDAREAYFRCKDMPEYRCIDDKTQLSAPGQPWDGVDAGKCDTACNTKGANDLSCAIARYGLDGANITNGINNSPDAACQYTPANFIHSVESIYSNVAPCDDISQCMLYYLPNDFMAPGFSDATLTLCYSRPKDCSKVAADQRCVLNPSNPNANGDISMTIDGQCMDPGNYTVKIGSNHNPSVYAEQTVTKVAGQDRINLVVPGVQNAEGDLSVKISVDAVSGQENCAFHDNDFFPLDGNNVIPDEVKPGTDSTEFGIRNCPFPPPTGAGDAQGTCTGICITAPGCGQQGLAVASGVCGGASQVCCSGKGTDTRTAEQREEHSLCVSCIENGDTWTAIGCVTTSVGGVFGTLVRIALGVMGGVVLLRAIYLGYLYGTGKTKQIEEARKGIISALWGIVIVIFSVLILRIIGVNILDIVPPGFFGAG